MCSGYAGMINDNVIIGGGNSHSALAKANNVSEDNFLKFNVVYDDTKQGGYRIEIDSHGDDQIRQYQNMGMVDISGNIIPGYIIRIEQHCEVNVISIFKVLCKNMQKAKISGDQSNCDAEIGGNQYNVSAHVGGNQYNVSAHVGGNQYNEEAKIGGGQSNSLAKIGRNQSNFHAEISGAQSNLGTKISGSQSNEGAKIGGNQLNTNAEIAGAQSNCGTKIGRKIYYTNAQLGWYPWITELISELSKKNNNVTLAEHITAAVAKAVIGE